MRYKWFWITTVGMLLMIAGFFALAIQEGNRNRAALAAATPTASSPIVETKSDGTATVIGAAVMSPGNIISIPVQRDRDHAPLSPILCVKCRTSLFVPNIGDKVSLEWVTFRQNPNAAPVEFPTATEYSPGHNP